MLRAAMSGTSPRTSSRARPARTTWLRSRHSSCTRSVCPTGAVGEPETTLGGRRCGKPALRSGWVSGPVVGPPRPDRPATAEEVALGQEPWPHAPVPSLAGDVWHWQLEAMHVVSRVRADLRARVAHPSVSSTSTDRSEEHTSELQSRQYLVCRLLLEKTQEKGTKDIKKKCPSYLTPPGETLGTRCR